MSLIKYNPWDPFEELDRLFRDWPAMNAGKDRGFIPAIDMYQTKDAVVVESPLSGIKPEDVEVTVENGMLTLRGENRHEREVDEKDYYRKEVRSGSFCRRIPLPADVKEEDVKAEFKSGILKITCPKEVKKILEGRKIEIEKK